MNYNTDTLFNNETLMLMAAVIIGTILFCGFFINFYLPFKEERDYIKMEMKRSLEEKEYLYWRKKLKMLYISQIPLARFIDRQKHKR